MGSASRFRPSASEAELLIVGRVFVLVLVAISIIWIPIIQVAEWADRSIDRKMDRWIDG